MAKAPKAPTAPTVTETAEAPATTETVVGDRDIVKVVNKKGQKFTVTGAYYKANNHKLTIDA